MSDLLDMDWINSLPQPFHAGDWSHERKRIWWPVNDFDVETGLYRIDVCGLLQVCRIGDHFTFMDGNGAEHSYEDFFADSERAIAAKTGAFTSTYDEDEYVQMLMDRDMGD